MPAPATFWRRYVAYSLDVAVVAAIAVPLLAWTLRDVPGAFDAAVATVQARMLVLMDEILAGSTASPDVFGLAHRLAADPVLHAAVETLAEVIVEGVVAALLTLFAIAACWFVGFESSARQATPGKAALGLRVTGVDGGRPPFGRVLARFLAGVPSWFFLHIGHAMAAFTKERRALHDLIAGTRVEQADPAGTPLPAWARAWLALQLAAFFAAAAYVFGSYALLLAETAGGGY